MTSLPPSTKAGILAANLCKNVSVMFHSYVPGKRIILIQNWYKLLYYWKNSKAVLHSFGEKLKSMENKI